MKIRRLEFTICIVLLLLSGCARTKVFTKNPTRLKSIDRIAVLPFVCDQPEIGFNIAESMSAHLLISRFTVIERSQLLRLLQEQDLTIEGIVTGRQSFVGKIRGVDALILGSATMDRGFAGLAYGGNKNYVSNCTARIVDVTTGEVLIAANFTADTANTWSGITTGRPK